MKKSWVLLSILLLFLGIKAQAQSLATLDVSIGGGGANPVSTQNLVAGFVPVLLTQVNSDTASGWNSATGIYTVPASGLYTITSSLRLVDNTAPASFAEGVNNAPGDGPWMVWNQFTGKRTTLVNTRSALLTSGTQLSLYGYCDSTNLCKIDSGHLIIQQQCTIALCAGSGVAGVTTLNGIAGALTIAAGTNVTLSVASNTITINSTGSGGGLPTPAATQIPIGNSGGTAYAAQTLSGDCTLTSAGVMTCLKVNGVLFGTAATTNASAYDAAGAYLAAQAAFTGDVTKAANSFATVVTKVNSGAVPVSAAYLATNSSGQLIAAATPLTNITGLITAGGNITLTGNGTSGTPYVIAATGSTGVASINSLSGAITLAAGANTTITPSGNTITIASSGTGTGLGDPGANGFVFRTAANVTAPGTYTQLEALLAADTVNNTAVGYHLGSGGDSTVPTIAAGVWYRVYKGGMLQDSHNGDAYVPSFPLSCQPSKGDGLNVVPSGTYLTTICKNDTGHTWHLTSISCVEDTGASTCNATNGAGTGLLTAAVTGSATYASGTQSATVTIAAGDFIKVILIADGTSHQIGIDVAGWY